MFVGLPPFPGKTETLANDNRFPRRGYYKDASWADGPSDAEIASHRRQGHLQSVFALPHNHGSVDTFVAPHLPTAREFYEEYAPGDATGVRSVLCARVAQRECGRDIFAGAGSNSPDVVSCDFDCLRTCLAKSRQKIERACLRRGAGRPFVMKRAAIDMPAMKHWSDDRKLAAVYGQLMVEYEAGKKEDRTGGASMTSVADFLKRYQDEDIYAVSHPNVAHPHHVPRGIPTMRRDVAMLPFLRCGGFTSMLDEVTMWWSSGGTKSVIHVDDVDNVNCLFSGRKRIIFWHPKHKHAIESKDLGWFKEDDRAADDQRYGEFSETDVDRVDLDQYPGWTKLDWWDAEMDAGDCVFIPVGWYHHVASFDRNIAVNVWFDRNEELHEGYLHPVPGLNTEATDDQDGCLEGPVASDLGNRGPTMLSHCSFHSSDDVVSQYHSSSYHTPDIDGGDTAHWLAIMSVGDAYSM
eukprot:SAG31_NODE_4498_length_3185_cov_36.595269_1_plen_464_part_00